MASNVYCGTLNYIFLYLILVYVPVPARDSGLKCGKITYNLGECKQTACVGKLVTKTKQQYHIALVIEHRFLL